MTRNITIKTAYIWDKFHEVVLFLITGNTTREVLLLRRSEQCSTGETSCDNHMTSAVVYP